MASTAGPCRAWCAPGIALRLGRVAAALELAVRASACAVRSRRASAPAALCNPRALKARSAQSRIAGPASSRETRLIRIFLDRLEWGRAQCRCRHVARRNSRRTKVNGLSQLISSMHSGSSTSARGGHRDPICGTGGGFVSSVGVVFSHISLQEELLPSTIPNKVQQDKIAFCADHCCPPRMLWL